MEDFTVYRADRTIRIGGGVCFYVNNLFTCKELLSYSNSTCEVLIIELSELNTIFMNIYRPPNCTVDKFKDVIDKASECLHILNTPMPKIILMGDLNMPYIDWLITSNTNNSNQFL